MIDLRSAAHLAWDRQRELPHQAARDRLVKEARATKGPRMRPATRLGAALRSLMRASRSPREATKHDQFDAQEGCTGTTPSHAHGSTTSMMPTRRSAICRCLPVRDPVVHDDVKIGPDGGFVCTRY